MKTVEEIYQEMLESFAQRSGMEVREGCDLAARLYAVAAQVYGLYVQADWVKRQCFPQTAQGEHLDHHAALRGLERKRAAQAEGSIRFIVYDPADTDQTIPAGTMCMTADLRRFETTEDGLLQAGQTWVDIPARAVEPGSGGNVAAGTVVSMAVAPVGVARCTNPAAFAGGTDAEGDEALRERVLSTFQRLPNGANSAFYQQGALSFDQVAAAAVLPLVRGRGTVDVVVATAAGLPGPALLSQLEEYFRQKREIAVDVQVRAPETVQTDVAVRVKCAKGRAADEVKRTVEDALRGYFSGKLLSQSVLRAKLGEVVFHCAGVENYDLKSPAADVDIRSDQLPVLGSLSVEEMT